MVAVARPGSVGIEMFAGQVTAGGRLSTTLTVKEQEGPASVLQVTVVVPMGKIPPDPGLHLTVPQAPVVVGVA